MRLELQNRILEENERRIQVESQVAQMEQDELELINKLKNTQMMQQTAYEDLEEAIGGDKS